MLTRSHDTVEDTQRAGGALLVPVLSLFAGLGLAAFAVDYLVKLLF